VEAGACSRIASSACSTVSSSGTTVRRESAREGGGRGRLRLGLRSVSSSW
jgi:hypothetical protein